MESHRISQIHPKAFTHPHDEAAIDALQKVPFLPSLLKKVSQFNIEERFRAHQMHSSILLGRKQLPSIWTMVNNVAERFGMPLPTAYVARHGTANAFAFGLEEHSIVLTTELVDLMTDRELEAIIAHELAHVLCEHMLYRNVGLALAAQGLMPISRLAPPVVGESVSMLFLAWSRAAEYSADRASLLVLSDPEALTSCLSRLAGVPRRFMSEFDPRQFIEQIHKYEEDATTWSKIVTWDIGLSSTHPEPTKRAAAILDWAGSKQYQDILKGRYITKLEFERDQRVKIEGVPSCPLCGQPVGNQPICPQCSLNQDPEQQRLCENQHPASVGWKHCKICGSKVQ